MSKVSWTQEQINFLTENYKTMTDEKLSKEISKMGNNRTKNAIERKRASLSLYKDKRYSLYGISDEISKEIILLNYSYKEACIYFCSKYNLSVSQIEYFYKKNNLRINKSVKWTDEECNYVLSNYKKISIEDMSKHIGRTVTSIALKLKKLNVSLDDCIGVSTIPERNKSLKEWTNKEIDFLKQNIEFLSYKEIAESLEKSIKAVMVKATKEKLIHHGTKWSPFEEEILQKNHCLSIYDLVFLLQRSEKSIKHKAKELGLYVSKRRNGVLFSEPERKIQLLLKELEIPFLTHIRPFTQNNYEVDIMLNNKICIEIQGDYWHGNPSIFTSLDITQELNILRDSIKKKLLEENGYTVVYLWESDINTDINAVKDIIFAVIGQDSQKTYDD